MTLPQRRLQLGSVSGSAAALVAPMPVAAAPASMTPVPSNARRWRSPLPATTSGSCVFLVARLPAIGCCSLRAAAHFGERRAILARIGRAEIDAGREIALHRLARAHAGDGKVAAH